MKEGTEGISDLRRREADPLSEEAKPPRHSHRPKRWARQMSTEAKKQRHWSGDEGGAALPRRTQPAVWYLKVRADGSHSGGCCANHFNGSASEPSVHWRVWSQRRKLWPLRLPESWSMISAPSREVHRFGAAEEKNSLCGFFKQNHECVVY